MTSSSIPDRNPSSPSTSYWQQAWDEARPRIDELLRNGTSGSESSSSRHPALTPRPVRVGQLDAEVLDEDLVGILKEPLAKALGLVNSSFKRYDAELVLFIRLVLYKFSLWDTGASYGAKLQGLRYRAQSSSSKLSRLTAPSGLPTQTLAAHAALTILIPYVHARVRARALSNAWPDTPSSDRRRKAWNLLTTVESTHATAALISFFIFLWNGRYRTIADRVLGLRLEPARRLANREVSYEFMNRQMVWHAFTEFLLFVLPLLNSHTMRRRTNKILSRVRAFGQFGGKKTGGKDADGRPLQLGRYAYLPTNQCAICAYNATFNISSISRDANVNASGTESHIPSDHGSAQFGGATGAISASVNAGPPAFPITNPYKTDCAHTYCYYCISEKLLRAADDGEAGWECLRCTALVKSCYRVTARVAGSGSGEGSEYVYDSTDYEDDDGNETRSSLFESDGDMISSFGTDLSLDSDASA